MIHLQTPATSSEQLAELYVQLGWSLVPIRRGSKVPAGPWKHHQTSRAGLEKVTQWIESGHGLGVVLGAISDDWVVRDFDRDDSYRRWSKAHPDAAAKLPTTKTGRGYHVFIRDPAVTKTTEFDDGELRSNGCYVVLPPSLHSDTGQPYQWLREPTLEANHSSSFRLSARSQCLNLSWSNVTESADAICGDSVGSTDSVYSVTAQKLAIAEAIESTVPSGVGHRNDGVFQFARKLIGILSRVPTGDEIERYGLMWYEQAKDNIGTQDSSVTVADLEHAIESVRVPDTGTDIIELAWKNCQTRPKPSFVAAHDDGSQGVLLAKLAVELDQLVDGDTWFLSCHVAARLTGLNPRQANRLLTHWVKLGVLELVKKGKPGPAGSPANRYRLRKKPR